MDKVVVRTKALSQALFSLATAGCDTVEVSVVEHAVKVEGIQEGDERVKLHVWSKEAEDTEASVGKGERQLTEEEIELLEAGKCPICEDHKQLSKGPKEALAINVSCDAGHLFWVPVKPFVPEYLGMPALEEEAKAQAEEAAAISEAEAQAEAEERAKAEEIAAEEAIRALEGGEESDETEDIA